MDGKYSKENEIHAGNCSGVMWTIQKIAATPHFKRDPPTIGLVKRVLVISLARCIFSTAGALVVVTV